LKISNNDIVNAQSLVFNARDLRNNDPLIVDGRRTQRMTGVYKNLAIANRSRVSCTHNTLRASIGLNITP